MAEENTSKLPENLENVLAEIVKQNNPITIKPAVAREFDVAILFDGMPMAVPGGCVSEGNVIDTAIKCFQVTDRFVQRWRAGGQEVPTPYALCLNDVDTNQKFIISKTNNNMIVRDEQGMLEEKVDLNEYKIGE